jgi:hypothetical protein
MTTRSTATYIAYDLRPAKQAERRMLLDYFEAMKECGLPISGYRYVGMGGVKFYDFAMVYRFLGISDLVSCERSPKTHKRGLFNRPFALIDVKNMSVGDYISTELSQKSAICWIDYDDSLSADIVDDIRNAGSHLAVGGALFVTVASGMPRKYMEMTEQQRLDQIKEEFGLFCNEVTLGDMEEGEFWNAYLKIIKTAFTNAFSGRKDGIFVQNFCVEYSDSTKMLTIGGCFVEKRCINDLKKSLSRRLKFVIKSQDKPYKIRNYNMTERERHLFEFSASARKNCSEAKKLRDLGFTETDLSTYRDLVRFMPRYVEALI